MLSFLQYSATIGATFTNLMLKIQISNSINRQKNDKANLLLLCYRNYFETK